MKPWCVLLLQMLKRWRPRQRLLKRDCCADFRGLSFMTAVFFAYVLQMVAAAELTFMSELQASTGTHDLTIAQVPLPGAYATGATRSGFTRGYNGGLPGPTFRMAPGQTLNVRLINNLQANRDVACSTTNSEYCKASTTNLHTHGLHVSSKGVADGLAAESDNIFAEVGPGTQKNYAFTIPSNHMPGIPQ